MLLIFQSPILPPDLYTWVLLIIIGICGCLGHTTLNKGAQQIDASRTAILRNADVAFVLFWQIIIFNEFPTGWSIIGIILITSSTFILALVKSRNVNKNNIITDKEVDINENDEISVDIEMHSLETVNDNEKQFEEINNM